MVIDRREKKILYLFLLIIGFYGPAIVFENILQNLYFNLRIVNWIWGFIFILFALYHYSRYKQYRILVIGIAAGTLLWHMEIIYYLSISQLYTQITHILILAFLLVFYTPHIALLRTKISLAHKKLLNLIKANLEKKDKYFEDKLYSAGLFDIHQDKLEGFLQFMQDEEIMFHKKEGDKIVLALCDKIIPINYSVDNIKEHLSYIKFFDSGKVKIKISYKDYYKFYNKYDYDEICHETILEFNKLLNLYKSKGPDEIKKLFNIDDKDIKLKYGLIMGISITLVLTSFIYIFRLL